MYKYHIKVKGSLGEMMLFEEPQFEGPSQEELWVIIQAFCKGFLLMPGLPSDTTMSFCRGLLILLERFVELEPLPPAS